MKIEDISDRVYQGRVYTLLDQAQSSIVISMYLIRPGEDPKHPVSRLLEDLIEARKRGVEVTLYLNTKFEADSPGKVASSPAFVRLREAGVQIKLVSPVRRLHDKLIVVDRRFVVEGSMNWSVSAIADNFESATLIESPELAESKLRRISFFPIWGEEEKKLPGQKEVLFPAGPPTSIEISVVFIEAKKYFPKMIAYQRARALKLTLLLLYLSCARGSPKFSFSPELAGEFLGILSAKDRSAIRREIIRILRDLATIDHLLRPEFRHGKEVWVELLMPAGPAFTLGSVDLGAGELAALTGNQIFVRLLRARLHEEETRLEDLTLKEIQRRFFVGAETLYRGGFPRRRSRKPAPAPL